MFTPEEKVRIRHHLGYLNVQASATFVLGVPAAVETQFIIERAFEAVLPEAFGEARRLIAVLDQIEEQMISDQELLAITKIGEIDINTREQDKLRKEYQYWRNGLANLLGVYPNPWDKRGLGGGGPNVPVIH